MKAYKTLEKIFVKVNDLEQTSSVLGWDMSVVMPNGGADARANQLATIEDIRHALITDDGVKDLIENSKSDTKKLNPWQKVNLEKIEKLHKHYSCVPAKLNSDLAKAGLKCQMVWREARANNDFKKFAPYLQEVVNIVRKIADIKSDQLGVSKYEALVDQYDAGRTEKQLDEVFEDLKEFLPSFVDEVVEKQKKEKITPLKGPFALEKQKILANKLLDIVGFDLNYGRFDESHHPFCGGYPSDIRITTRYDENDFTSAIMGVLHESGHAMYEAGLPKQFAAQPAGKACGLAIHESQSLLIEMQACRTKEFCGFISPIYKEILASKSRALSGENLYKLATRVTPSLIRVDADEVTYPLHVTLRYYLEKYLINKEMEVSDLPQAWSEGMEAFLGIKPECDANGCMQDIHWTDGTFGYFPTYTFGAIYAAQIFKAAKDKDQEILPSISKGDFKPLKKWLGDNIHRKASRYTPDNLVKSATGEVLNLEIYKTYLKEKYLA